MTKEKKDSKQEKASAPSEKSTDKKEPETPKEEEPLKKQEVEEEKDKEELTQELKKEKEARQKAEKKASDFEQAFFKEKKRREEEIETPPTPKNPQDDDDEFDVEKDTREAVKKELDKRNAEEQKENLKEGIRLFVSEFSQYSPEVDVGNLNWDKIKPHVDELKQVSESGLFKGNAKEYLERLKTYHHGITRDESATPPGSEDEEVEDSGVANVPTQPEGKKKKASAMTRPLNDYEKVAFETGGWESEEVFRKALARQEGEKVE